MSTALIAGFGLQGVAIAYGLNKLGYSVTAVELSDSNIVQGKSLLDKLGMPVGIIRGDAASGTLIKEMKPDIFVSALPFHLNLGLAAKCIEAAVRYCDLGGNVDTSNAIQTQAEQSAAKPLMADLGLAPGMANNIAELGYLALQGHADSIKIRVGGLPAHPKGTLKYGLTFNPQGLYNEYVENCLVIKDGRKQTVGSLIDEEPIHFDDFGDELSDLVAFNTSGGIANLLDSMLDRGVRECNYKTIRFPGHVEYMRFLLFDCKLDLPTFTKAITNACEFITDDQVLIQIEVSNSASGETWFRQFRILHDENFTAMQKTTGFGAAAVAAILGSGAMDHKRYANYVDVPPGDFVRNMNILLPELSL